MQAANGFLSGTACPFSANSEERHPRAALSNILLIGTQSGGCRFMSCSCQMMRFRLVHWKARCKQIISPAADNAGPPSAWAILFRVNQLLTNKQHPVGEYRLGFYNRTVVLATCGNFGRAFRACHRSWPCSASLPLAVSSGGGARSS